MLFNELLGEFQKDSPFDIRGHRASLYNLSPNDPKNQNNHQKLTLLVTEAIRVIVISQPQRPFDLLNKSPEEVKHLRDIDHIRWVMNTLHIPTIDDMLLSLPRHLNSRVMLFWESFNGVVTNSLFYIYDEELRETINLVHKSWDGCISSGEQYHIAADPDLYVFSNPGDASLDEEQEKKWNNIESACISLRQSLDRLLQIIRERYLEININETNKNAWDDYVLSVHELSLLQKSMY